MENSIKIEQKKKMSSLLVLFVSFSLLLLLLCLKIVHVLEFSPFVINISNRKNYEGSTLHTCMLKEEEEKGRTRKRDFDYKKRY